MSTTPEGKVKAKGRKLCKRNGVYFFPVNQGPYGSNGVPDDCLCVNGQFVFIEYKHCMYWEATPRGIHSRPSRKQVAAMQAARDAGAVTLVVDKDNIDGLEQDLDLMCTAYTNDKIYLHRVLICRFNWSLEDYIEYNLGNMNIMYRFTNDKNPECAGPKDL